MRGRSRLLWSAFEGALLRPRRDFQTPYLLCDCNLLWLLRWIKERNIAVKNTKCSFPQSLQGQFITSIRPELLTCGRHCKEKNCTFKDLRPRQNKLSGQFVLSLL